jgi:hypothetical protein
MVLPREPVRIEKVISSYLVGRQIVFVGELGTTLRLPVFEPLPAPTSEAPLSEDAEAGCSCHCCEPHSVGD